MKHFIKLFFFAACLTFAIGAKAGSAVERPKLVVGIVVDQMRWDYLKRFVSRYGEGGFKRLMNQGFSYDNTNIDYIPTVTAIGHTSIYTGSVPSIHGIAGNNFRDGDKMVYCTDDSTVQSVGSTSKEGEMSPRRLLVTTVGDELRLATNYRSHVISVSLKDRASILPGGHASNGSFWFDGSTGRFITSTYYMKQLPAWVEKFNAQGLAKKYMDQDWNTLYPINSYQESTADDTPYEGSFFPGQKPTFPIATSKLITPTDFGKIRETPYGNTFTLDLAKAAIAGEQLGQRGETDLLAVSLSSTDYVGHRFGPNSVEIEDTYLRLDKDLASFFDYLDKTVGAGNYMVFLTADHGAAHNYRFLQDRNIPAGNWADITQAGKKSLNANLKAKYGVDNLVQSVSNYQIFLNRAVLAQSQINEKDLKAYLIDYLGKLPGVAYVVDQQAGATAPIPSIIRERMINGYNRDHSGEIQVIMQPGWYSMGSSTGTTHGNWNPYDAHIPLLFMGWHVPQGRTARLVHMTDIAATVAAMLDIQQPNGCVGEPLLELSK